MEHLDRFHRSVKLLSFSLKKNRFNDIALSFCNESIFRLKKDGRKGDAEFLEMYKKDFLILSRKNKIKA